MRKRSRIIYLIFAVLTACAFAAAASGQSIIPGQDPQQYNSTVQPPPQIVASGDVFSIEVKFHVEKDVHLYKNHPSSLRFKPDEMENAKFLRIVYPPSILVKDIYGTDPNKDIEVFEGDFYILVQFQSTGKEGDPVKVRGELWYYGCDNLHCFDAVKKPLSFDLTTGPGPGYSPETTVGTGSTGTVDTGKVEPPSSSTETGGVTAGESAVNLEGHGIIFLIAFAFVAGLGLSLTPCVYPLIPITAGIVRSFGSTKKLGAFFSSLIYISGFAAVYAALGVISAFGGEAVKNALSSPPALIIIAAIMVALALSMFGLYELKLPDSFTTRVQQAAAKTSRNKIGLFLMGLLGGCMVGPCLTGPLASVLTFIAKRADVGLGAGMMFSVALGMSVLLVVVGTFNTVLPRSGEWLRRVNVTFGFILLGVGAYYLSSLIGDGPYYLILGALCVALPVFLGCWDRLTSESGLAQRILQFVGIILLLAGIGFGLNGYAHVAGINLTGQKESPDEQLAALKAKQFKFGGEKEVEAALKSGKPVVLDFWTEPCDICVFLEREIFSGPRVIKELANFETVKIDIRENDALVRKFSVVGAPTILFFDAHGKEVTDLRLTGGTMTVEECLAKLRRAAGK